MKGTAYPAGFGARFSRISPLAQAALRNFVEVVRSEETTGENLGRPQFELVEILDREEQPEPEPAGV